MAMTPIQRGLAHRADSVPALPSDRAVAASAAEPVPVSSVPASIPSAKRDWRGRFIRKLKAGPDDERSWLIWSKKWNCWHRRSETGGACGYTSDIAQAGIFPRTKAVEYHDGYDNEAFHISEKLALIDRRIEEHQAEAALVRRLHAQAIEAQRAETQGGSVHESAVPTGDAP